MNTEITITITNSEISSLLWAITKGMEITKSDLKFDELNAVKNRIEFQL